MSKAAKMLPVGIEAMMEAAAKEGAAFRRKLSVATGFRPVSLGDFISLVKTCGVPHVEAEMVGEMPIEILLEIEVNGAEIRAFEDRCKAAVRRGHMLRWDCCSGSEVKSRLGRGLPRLSDDMIKYFSLADPRVYDLVWEHPGAMMQVWQRPWMKAYIIADFPVEFRVFVERGAVIAISSYYPQRPLPLDGKILQWAASAVDYTRRLADAMPRPICCPQIEKTLGVDEPSFTADYLVTEAGNVLWLEGGPPHLPTWGAHPCCFLGRKPDGLALRAEGAEE